MLTSIQWFESQDLILLPLVTLVLRKRTTASLEARLRPWSGFLRNTEDTACELRKFRGAFHGGSALVQESLFLQSQLTSSYAGKYCVGVLSQQLFRELCLITSSSLHNRWIHNEHNAGRSFACCPVLICAPSA